MVFTNYPDGVTSLGVPVLGNSIPTTSGNYWFVSSTTGSNGNDGTSMASPLATVAYTVANKCTAAKGDVVVVLPYHTEAVIAATTLALSKSGVSIVGLGQGTGRPTFTLSTANTATIAVSAADISIDNCIFVANFLSIATCFTLTTATNFKVTNCYFVDTSSVLNFLAIVTVGAGANLTDGLTFNQNQVVNLGVTSNNTTLTVGGTIDRFAAKWNLLKWAVQNDKPILMDVTTGILTNADIGYNKGYRPNTTTAGGSFIKLGGTTSTGWVYNNYVQTLTTATDLLFTTSVGLSAFNNYVTGVVGASGFLIPAADS